MFLWRTGENYPTIITKYSLTIPLLDTVSSIVHLIACQTADPDITSSYPSSATFKATDHEIISVIILPFSQRVAGSFEGVVCLTSPGHPTDIALQLGKACYPCSR